MLGNQIGSQFSSSKESILKGNVIPEFFGIRVRMGVHTSPVDKVSRHPVTNRVMYPNGFVRHTTMISDTACGGQVVMSSQTLAETETDASGSWVILHLGAHILEKPPTEEDKSVQRSMRMHKVAVIQPADVSEDSDGTNDGAADEWRSLLFSGLWACILHETQCTEMDIPVSNPFLALI